MGSFTHEAVAADPSTRTLFLTEDDPDGRLYRFTPAQWGQLEAGTLEVARTSDNGAVAWIPADASGGTNYAGGEGIAYYDGSVVFTTKSDGRIRAYDTRTAQMRVLYEPGQDPEILGPDNITFALNGDLYVCEDTPADQDLLLFGADGTRTQVLRLDASHAGSELAGVAFDPSGTRMYISSQRGGGGDGVTYEISGPFRTLAVPATSDHGRTVVQRREHQRCRAAADRTTPAAPSTTAPPCCPLPVRSAARQCLRSAAWRGCARAGYDTGVTLFPGPSLDELRDAVDRCTACDLYKEATQAVFGEGPRDAALMLMGEVPGDKEDLAGHPFVGPAGKVLDEALADVGIDRAEIYLTNAVKHFKFERRGKVRIHKKPNAAEIHACSQWWQAELRQVRPDVLGILGATAGTPSSGRASASRSSGASGCRRRTAPRRSRRSIRRRCCERRPSGGTRSTRVGAGPAPDRGTCRRTSIRSLREASGRRGGAA